MRARSLVAAALLAGCASTPPGTMPAPRSTDPALDAAGEPLRHLLTSRPALRDAVARAAELRLQVVLGVIEPGSDGRPVLRQHTYRAGAEYFYPASAVKLFAAVAALERLHELADESGLPVDVDTPLAFSPLFPGETVRDADPTNLAGGTITVRHELRKLFLVSDNEAFNRLYELVGQDRLAASLARAGLGTARLVHRLSVVHTAEENRQMPRVELRVPPEDGGPLVLPERRTAPLPPPPPAPGLAVGTASFAGDQKLAGPMDFAPKNRFSLVELQRGLCAVVRPDVDCGGAAYSLTDADRALLHEAMSQFPRQSANPVYDPAEYPDSWSKLLLPGLEKRLPRDRFRIDNKFGQAYGFSTENAWVVDAATGRGFFLAATLYTNADGVLNDDQYDYASVATPFFTALGESLAEWFWPESESAQPKNR